MPNLYAQISPTQIFTDKGEPKGSDIRNRLVVALRNLSGDEDVMFQNKDAREYSSFQLYEKAVVIPGLSYVYLRFALGEADNCLTSVAQFTQAGLYGSQDWKLVRQEDGIVFYPTRDLAMVPGAATEFIVDALHSSIAADTATLCGIKLVNVEKDAIRESTIPLFKLRCPLNIAYFSPQTEDVVTGFRDTVRLQWLVNGADQVILKPGDENVATSGCQTVTILDKACYTLSAIAGTGQATASLRLEPLTASITSFSGKADFATRQVAFSWKVSNTRHVFLSGVGRLPAGNGGQGSYTLTQKEGKVTYKLAVENVTGLVEMKSEVSM